MPISTAKVFGNGALNIVNNAINWSSDTINMSLHTSTYTPDQDLHDFFNDATNELTAGSGYSAGGVALAGKTVTYDGATNEVRLDCNDIVFAFTGAKTWRTAVVYKKRGGVSSADELIGYLTWDADQTVSTSYTLVVDATGLLKFTVA